jgi:uncharacterized protein (TIGR00251 family)
MTLPYPPFLRVQKDGSVIVDVHVMPNAARTQIQGLHDGALRIRLQAPPVDGKANLALQQWLARQLGVPRVAIELVRGSTSRRKQLRVQAHHAADVDWTKLQIPQDG